MMELFRTGAGNSGRTMFDALNAATDWVDHKRQFATAATSRAPFPFRRVGGAVTA